MVLVHRRAGAKQGRVYKHNGRDGEKCDRAAEFCKLFLMGQVWEAWYDGEPGRRAVFAYNAPDWQAGFG